MKDRGEEAETFDRLIGRMAQGETDAVRAFFDRYGRLLYAAALSLTHSPPLAEEAADGVLVRLWRDAGRIPKIRRPLSWLYTIARNQAKNVLRGERKAAPLSESACEETGFARVEAEDGFHSYIACLGERERRIMIFRFVEGLSFREIAEEMKLPLNTVSSMYYRALEKIRKKISALPQK